MPRGPRGEKRPADVKTLQTSPAMATGIETRLWSMDDVVRLIERREDLRSGALLVG